jgi:putative amidoligase enzyme
MKRITKQAAKALDTSLADWYPVQGVQGEVGIEIECEGANLVRRLPKFWVVKEDGSLRGESCEYVLNGPVKREQVDEALDLLAKTLKDAGSVVNDSYRTSVHVHINQTDLKFRQIFAEICLYLIVEDLLMEFCGEDRIGNLFCLRVKDAEHLLDSLRNGITSGNYNSFNDMQTFKYGAVNIAAAGKYGSLEYRSLRGTTNPELIKTWVQVLLDIKDASKQVQSPQEFIHNFSQMSPQDFICKYFSKGSQELLLNSKNIKDRMFEGVRFAQEIAFAIPSWEPYVEKIKAEAQALPYNLDYGALNKAVGKARAAARPPAWDNPMRFVDVVNGEQIIRPLAGDWNEPPAGRPDIDDDF